MVGCGAAQESRVCQRREREFQDDLVKKYYAEQRNADSAARDALKAPVKRREREAKERQAEIDMLESMYRVSAFINPYMCHNILQPYTWAIGSPLFDSAD